MNTIINLVLSALAVLITSYVLPGVAVAGFGTALIVALVLGLLNLLIKPIIVLLTLPVNILTLGLFTLVINAAIVMIAGSIVPGFTVTGFWSAFFFGLILSVVAYGLHVLVAGN